MPHLRYCDVTTVETGRACTRGRSPESRRFIKPGKGELYSVVEADRERYPRRAYIRLATHGRPHAENDSMAILEADETAPEHTEKYESRTTPSLRRTCRRRSDEASSPGFTPGGAKSHFATSTTVFSIAAIEIVLA